MSYHNTKGIMDYTLTKGAHQTANEGRCAMEWVSYLAGEPHTDKPVCVSPVLQSFGIALNDQWDDAQRQKLRPYLARCIGTAGDGRDEERSMLAVDWLIRVYTPAFLELVPSLAGHAEKLRALPPVLAIENVARAMEAITPARTAAGDAAWAAAGNAAWAAAWDAARDAAWAAAGNAARAAARDAARAAAGNAARAAAWAAARAAARDAAGNAAWAAAGNAARDAARDAAWDAAWAAAWAAAGDAARDAARDAAGDAARDALQPTVHQLQASALDLFDRMLPTELVQIPALGLDEAAAVCGVPVAARAA